MQVKKLSLAARHWHSACIIPGIPGKENKHPPVADPSTPQASNQWMEVLDEGKNEIWVELCVLGTG
jgi:hypothetical protein